jgi:hypothetical protein
MNVKGGSVVASRDYIMLASNPLVLSCRNGKPYDTRLSIDVSMGFVLRDLRNEDNPGVRAAELETILMSFCTFPGSGFGDFHFELLERKSSDTAENCM